MTEFGSAGFSAVAAFFGRGDDDSATLSKPPDTRKAPFFEESLFIRKSRLGLGASDVKRVNTDGAIGTLTNGNDTKRKILTIGRKHNTRNTDDDDDLSDEEARSNFDDEEDEGRTTAVRVKTKRTDFVSLTEDGDKEAVVGTRNKKKKLGKKERQLAAVYGGKDSKSDPVEYRGADNKTEAAADHILEKGREQKRRKPKVRSRQKNIRKDSRTAAEKPGHLVPGTTNFSGRPLTKETREYLKLPTSNTTSKKRLGEEHCNRTDDRHDTTRDDPHLGLAVDDLLRNADIVAEETADIVDGNADIVAEETAVIVDGNADIVVEETAGIVDGTTAGNSSKALKKKRTRKSKYKNLR